MFRVCGDQAALYQGKPGTQRGVETKINCVQESAASKYKHKTQAVIIEAAPMRSRSQAHIADTVSVLVKLF